MSQITFESLLIISSKIFLRHALDSNSLSMKGFKVGEFTFLIEHEESRKHLLSSILDRALKTLILGVVYVLLLLIFTQCRFSH